MDAVAHARDHLEVMAPDSAVVATRHRLEAAIADRLVGRWCVELPGRHPSSADHLSIEEFLVGTRLVDLNGEALRLMQAASVDELAGASLASFVATSSRPAMAELLRKGRQGSAAVTPVCLLTKPGTPMGVRIAAVRLQEAGDRLLLMGCESPLPDAAVDELIRSEERYRRLFQRMPIALWRVDSRGIKAILGEAREAGVTDLVAHFLRHPELFEFALDSITIAEVNDLTVQLSLPLQATP